MLWLHPTGIGCSALLHCALLQVVNLCYRYLTVSNRGMGGAGLRMNIPLLNSRKDKDLLKAIRTNDMRLFNAALEKRANINRTFDYGWTPLMWASFKGNLTMVEILVDRGANPKTKNNDKNTAEMIACWDAPTVDPKTRNKILMVLKGDAHRITSISSTGETKSNR